MKIEHTAYGWTVTVDNRGKNWFAYVCPEGADPMAGHTIHASESEERARRAARQFVLEARKKAMGLPFV